MDTLIRDIRYSARKLLRTPGFTAIVVGTLSLAIGATTAVFSIVNGVLLEPLSLRDAARVVSVSSIGRDGKRNAMSLPDFFDYRAQSKLVASMSAMDGGTHNLTATGGEPVRLTGARVNANFFDVVGVSPILGRGFIRGDDEKNAGRTVVLSEALWRSRFGSDPAIIGRELIIDGRQHTVIGVVPRIEIPRDNDVWLPLIPANGEDDPSSRGAHFLRGVGRLAPGATVERAAVELAQIARRLAQQYPESNSNFGATVISLHEAIVGNVRAALFVMLAGVGFVLLIACANVANLLLVRASTRETEIAVRTALGAAKGQLVRQLVTESMLLALGGTLVGTALAAWAVDAVKAFGPRGVPRLDNMTIDGRVLVFSAVVAILTGLLFGLAPALHAAKTNVGQMLKESTRGSSARRGAHRTRGTLVVAEMALAVILLIGAGLLARSFVALTSVDTGYRAENVVTMSVTLPSTKYPWDQQAISFVHQVLDRTRQLPEVQGAAVAFGRPLDENGMRVTFERTDRPPSTPDKRLVADVRAVSPEFFSTLHIPVIAGRGLQTTDSPNAPQVVVVSQAFVKQFYPNENPLGKHIVLGWGRQRSENKADTVNAGGEIVGVIGDVKSYGASEAAPSTVYLPYDQGPIGDVSVLVRSTASPSLTINGTRAAIKEVDNDLPVFDIKKMTDVVNESIAQPRFYAILLGSFAGIALVIAALGIYGVISYAVTQRTRELGIRIALGAQRERVVRLVIGQGLTLTLLGIALGIAGAFMLTRLIATMLFGVAPADPLTFAGVATMFVLVACLASYLPARRAAGVDPIIAMRAE
ncbi:MAG TPA: ABC transporter permease [Gemmatimonadaceae bacterium]|nr:ABC transporter permease [Gemmatimonadaceae bacterium]